jgi:hypothetical protein
VVTVGSIHGGSKHNIIPDEVKLQLTVRSYEDSTRERLLDEIRHIAQKTSELHRAPRAPEVKVQENGFPAVYHDPTLTERMRKVFVRLLSESACTPRRRRWARRTSAVSPSTSASPGCSSTWGRRPPRRAAVRGPASTPTGGRRIRSRRCASGRRPSRAAAWTFSAAAEAWTAVPRAGRLSAMPYRDLQHFIEVLEQKGMLKRIKAEVSQDLEIAEITDRASKQGGPALLFENVKGHSMPVAINLFGTKERMALALEVDSLEKLPTASARSSRSR